MVVSFDTTEDVMELEEKAPGIGLPGRIIPLPPEIDAGCGMAWAVLVDESENLASKIREAGLAYSSITLVELFAIKEA